MTTAKNTTKPLTAKEAFSNMMSNRQEFSISAGITAAEEMLEGERGLTLRVAIRIFTNIYSD